MHDVVADLQAQPLGARRPRRAGTPRPAGLLDEGVAAPGARTAGAVARARRGAVPRRPEQHLGDLLEEAAGRVPLDRAPQSPAGGVGQVEVLAGPGHADVAQPALFLELVGLAHGP